MLERRQAGGIPDVEWSNSVAYRRYEVADPGTAEYHIILGRAIDSFHQKTFIKPSQEISMDRAREKAAKSVSVAKGAETCLHGPRLTNPDSTTGCLVTSRVLEQVKFKQASTIPQKEEEAARKEVSTLKKAQVLDAARKVALTVLENFKRGSDEWKKASLDQLKAAFKKISNTSEKKEKMKVKADYIIVLSIYLQRAPVDPAPSLEQMAADAGNR